VQGDYLGGEKSSAKKLNAKKNYLSWAGVGARRSVGAGPATYQIRTLPPAAEQAPKKIVLSALISTNLSQVTSADQKQKEKHQEVEPQTLRQTYRSTHLS
jgi:hypothetical protein